MKIIYLVNYERKSNYFQTLYKILNFKFIRPFILGYLIILLSYSHSKGQSIQNIFFNDSTTPTDTLNWDLASIDIPMKISFNNFEPNLDSIKIYVKNEQNIQIIIDKSLSKGNILIGKMVFVNNKSLIGLKKIIISDFTTNGQKELIKAFYLSSNKIPRLLGNTPQRIPINAISRKWLKITNLQTVTDIKVFNTKDKLYIPIKDFEVEIFTKNIDQDKVELQIFCRDKNLISNNNIFRIFVGNKIYDENPLSTFFLPDVEYSRFNELAFLVNQQADLIIKNNINYQFKNDDNIELEGLNDNKIKLDFNKITNSLIANNVLFKKTYFQG